MYQTLNPKPVPEIMSSGLKGGAGVIVLNHGEPLTGRIPEDLTPIRSDAGSLGSIPLRLSSHSRNSRLMFVRFGVLARVEEASCFSERCAVTVTVHWTPCYGCFNSSP